MACCRHRGAAMSYRGDYGPRRLLTGHFITVTGRQEGEKRERKRREVQKNRKRSKKNTIGAECRESSVDSLWQEQNRYRS